MCKTSTREVTRWSSKTIFTSPSSLSQVQVLNPRVRVQVRVPKNGTRVGLGSESRVRVLQVGQFLAELLAASQIQISDYQTVAWQGKQADRTIYK
jgi:hypothetical protein